MLGAKTKLDGQAWRRVYRVTGIATALVIVASVIMTNFFMETFSRGVDVQGLMASIVIPLVLAGPSIGLIVIRQEQLRQANQRLQKLATFDWLTNCYNRGAFTQKVEAALNRSGSSALLVIDVDHFKAINDKHGHDRGDDALRLIAGTLQQMAGPDALVGRLGGEEFAVFLQGTDSAAVARIAEALRAAVARLAFVTDGTGCPLSVSIGGAIIQGKTDFRMLYRCADDCLYQAKNSGRDRVALIDAA